LFGIFLTPVFYVMLRSRRARRLALTKVARPSSAVTIAPTTGEAHV
ncbi:MAG: hypothetical protein JWQ11_4216, partial [Rhizobacter sp.]|nr:hypothetical protein [Rhizobacter sp.]